MLVEMICALAVCITLRLVHYHILKAIEQDAELAAKVRFLSVKVRELRQLNNTLAKQNQVYRVAHSTPYIRNINSWQMLVHKYWRGVESRRGGGRHHIR
jgi:hypothetical protein